MSRVLLAVVLGFSLSAQQTWIVDQTGGGQFSNLGLAIAAASPGDTLLLQNGGDYAGNFTVDKVLAIVGLPPQRPRIYGLSIGPAMVGLGTVSVSGLDVNNLRVFAPSSFENLGASTYWVDHSTASFHRCTLGGATDLYGMPSTGTVGWVYYSTALFTSCTMRGGRGWYHNTMICNYWAGRPPVNCEYGDVTIADCTLIGSNSVPILCLGGPYWSPPGIALVVIGDARVTRSTLIGGMDQNAVRTAPVVVNSTFGGTFEYDGSTVFTPGNTVGTLTFLPATGGQGATRGGTMACRVETQPNLPAVLVAGLGFRAPVAMSLGLAWVDLNAYVVLALGVTDGAGLLGASIAVPLSAPRGLPITVQSVAPDANGALKVGAPAVLHVL